MPIKKALSIAVSLLAQTGVALMLISAGRAQGDPGLQAQAQGKKAKGFDRPIDANIEKMIEEGLSLTEQEKTELIEYLKSL